MMRVLEKKFLLLRHLWKIDSMFRRISFTSSKFGKHFL